MQIANLIYIGLFWILLSILALAAWRWGQTPERQVSVIYIAAAAVSVLVRSSAYYHAELALLAVDILLLAGLILIALSADRFWPMPSAALQALSCLAHLQKLLEPHSYTLGYQILAECSGYPMLAILALGIWRANARTKREAGSR